MNHTAQHGSILGTAFLVGCEGLLKGVLEEFLLPTNSLFSIVELTIIRVVLAGGHQARGLPISLELSAVECECYGCLLV